MSNKELKVGTFNLSCSSLIEASAGTGKTYTITYLVLRLLLGSKGFDDEHPELKFNYDYKAGPLELKNILVVTFTKAAASDLKARIREKIVIARSVFEKVSKKGIEVLDSLELEEQMKSLVREMVLVNKTDARVCALLLLNAERSIDEAPICTIHSFCTSALHKIYTFEAGESFGVQLSEDISEQSLEAKNTVWRELFYKGDENSRKLAALLSVDSDDKLFDTLKNCQKILERVRNTDEKEGYFGYNLLNIKKHNSSDIRRTVENALKHLDEELNHFLEITGRVKAFFNEFDIITNEDLPGEFFSKVNPKAAAPQFKISTKAGYSLLRDFCQLSDDEELKLTFIRSSFPDGDKFCSISRVADRAKYTDTFRNAQKIIELENLYESMASLHNSIDSVKTEIMFDIAIMAEQKLDEILDRDNLIGFDGIIRRLDYVLNYKEGSKDTLPGLIRASYPVAMIDEFQDTDPVQFSIFSKLYLNENAKKVGACCYLIGDPKQSIYGFRKADIHSYLKARSLIEDLYGKDSIYTLSTNFRSQEQIVEGVNRIFSLRDDPFFFDENSKDNIAFNRVNAKVKKLGNSGKCSFRFSNEKNPSENFSAASNYVEILLNEDIQKYGEEAGISGLKAITGDLIANRLACAVENCLSHGILDSVSGDRIVSRAVKPSDIAILVRNGREAKLLQAALKEKNISSVYYSDNSKVFDEETSDNSTAEYELILYLIEAMEDYANRGKVRRLLLSQLCSASGLDSMDSQSDSLELEVALLKECRVIWEKNGFYPAFSKWANDERHQCLKENLSFSGGERMVTNLWHLAELLQSARTHEQGIQAQKRWYQELRSNPSANSDAEMFSKRLESEASQVAIYTIFKSKGLEFPLVFMPYLWNDMRDVKKDDAFYYDEKDEKLYFDILGTEKTLEQKRTSDLQEDARLLYVALTRACAANFMYIAQLEEKNPNSLISEFLSPKLPEKLAYLNANALVQGQITTGQAAESASESENNPQNQKNPFILVDNSFYESVLKESPVIENKLSDADIHGPSEFDENFGGIRQNYRISSYSGIVARSEDGGTLSPVLDIEVSKKDFSRFNFPRNAIAGTYLHSLMEFCDFSDSLSAARRMECIKKAALTNEAGILKRWSAFNTRGLSENEIIERKHAVLVDWIADIVQAKLPCGDSNTFRLCDLKKGEWLSELEFLFPSKNFDSDKLVDLRAQNAAEFAKEKAFNLPEKMDFSLAKNELSGFVKGFIDLAIKVGEGDESRFYVLDYKSNFMGVSPEDYSENAVAMNMLEHCYDVQYLFYSLAMHRFLQTRIENYSYDKHFGGIIYLYLRGMRKDSSDSVVYTRPKYELIEKLSSIFGY